MNVGDEVVFYITGMMARYKGTISSVDDPVPYRRGPQIKVTHVWDGDRWVADPTWQTLKDGDYILTEMP